MTLIQAMVVNNPVSGDSTIAVTSDTRNVLRLGSHIISQWKSTKDKILRISPYCIFAGGGENRVFKHVATELERCKGQHLLDFYMPFTKIINEMRNSKGFSNLMNDETCSQMFLIGFNALHMPGILSFRTGKEQKVEMTHLDIGMSYFTISPSEDENNVIKDIQRTTDHRISEKEDETLGSMLVFMAGIQQVLNSNDSKTVSDELIYSAIASTSAGFLSFEDAINLGEVTDNEETLIDQ